MADLLRVGNKKLKDISLGNQDVSKIYKGDVLVWSKEGDEPFHPWSDYEIVFSANRAGTQIQALGISDDGQYITASIIGGNQNEQLRVSSDGGNTFTKYGPNTTGWMTEGIKVSGSGQYQLALLVNKQIYTSSNYGITWTARHVARLWLGAAMSQSGQYQIAGCAHIRPIGTMVGETALSTDYGATWTTIQSARLYTVGRPGMSKSGQHQLLPLYESGTVTTIDVLKSNDYGSNWVSLNKSISGSVSGAYISDDGLLIIMICDNILHKSIDGGLTWNEVTHGVFSIWSGIFSGDGKYITIGSPSQRNNPNPYDRLKVSDDYGETWIRVFDGSVVPETIEWTSVAMSTDGKYRVAGTYATSLPGGEIYITRGGD